MSLLVWNETYEPNTSNLTHIVSPVSFLFLAVVYGEDPGQSLFISIAWGHATELSFLRTLTTAGEKMQGWNMKKKSQSYWCPYRFTLSGSHYIY